MFDFKTTNYVVIIDLLKKNQFIPVLFIHLFIPMTPIGAIEPRDYLFIDQLVESCYKDNLSCDQALFKIHNYQRNAASNSNFSCQTRLLGLEANLIMVMNSNMKKKEVRSILQAIKKYC